jgi:hypothetical protein
LDLSYLAGKGSAGTAYCRGGGSGRRGSIEAGGKGGRRANIVKTNPNKKQIADRAAGVVLIQVSSCSYHTSFGTLLPMESCFTPSHSLLNLLNKAGGDVSRYA